LIDASPANPRTTSAPTTKGNEISYAKPGVGKYYKCGEPEHKSNECPKMRHINMANYEDEDEVLIKTEPEDSDFVEKKNQPPV